MWLQLCDKQEIAARSLDFVDLSRQALPPSRVFFDTDTSLQIRHRAVIDTDILHVRWMETQRFSVGAQVEQTNLEVEHIARAFYSARYENADWEKASRVLKHEYRLYARQALQMLERRQEHRQEERKASPLGALESA